MFTTVRFLCAVLLATAGLSFAGPKAPPTPTSPKLRALIAQALEETEAKVGGCVLEAETGVVWTKVVKLELTLDGEGKLTKTTVAFERGELPDTTRKCIEAVLAAVPFPKMEKAITKIERVWTFSMR